MKKLYNVIFPIWLILLVPPIVLIVIPSNFIIDSIVLIIGFKLLKLTNWFDKYKSSILKVWIIGFIVDILGSLLLLLTQFIPFNEYLNDNLIYPLVWNPFESILALLYILIVVIVCGVLIYFINYKYSFKKTGLDNKQKRFISILLGFITAPYLFFFPTSILYTSSINTLSKYENTYIGDNSKVGNIISNIYSGSYMDTFSLDTKDLPYGLTINYKEDTYLNIYKNLEEDALILFKLINNIDYVEFKINENIYRFDSEYIENIYENIKEIEISDISSRYNNEYFDKFTYLGHIDKYDVFDTSTTCGIDKNEIYRDNEYIYYVECSDIDALYLVNDSKKIKVKTALEKEIINTDNLFEIALKISKEVKNEINS